MIGMLVEGIGLDMKLDTGASVSVISDDEYQKLQHRGLKKKLTPTNARLRGVQAKLQNFTVLRHILL